MLLECSADFGPSPLKKKKEKKILFMTYKAVHAQASFYIEKLIEHYHPPRALHSVTLRTAGNLKISRSFLYLAPLLWNHLQVSVRGGRHRPSSTMKLAVRTTSLSVKLLWAETAEGDLSFSGRGLLPCAGRASVTSSSHRVNWS